MDIYQQHKKIFLFGGIFVGVVILYFLFFSGGQSPAQGASTKASPGGLVTEVAQSSSDVIVGRELLNLLAEIQTISLDFSIFDNPVFGSLEDWSRPIEPQPLGKSLGRKNPFSEFSSDESVAAAKAAQAQATEANTAQ